MLILSLTVALIALTLFFDDLLTNQVNPNRNPDTRELIAGGREVVLKRNRQGHYIAAGKINDIPVTFLVDTGATDVAIPSNIANQAGLSRGQAAQAATANGLVTVYSTKVESLVLGTPVISFKEVEGLVDIFPYVETNNLYLCQDEYDMEQLLKQLPSRPDYKNLSLRENLLCKFNTPFQYSKKITILLKGLVF